MVVVLTDQFHQLLFGIATFLCTDTIDKWNFRPNHKADAVTFCINTFRLLVVCKTDSCGTDFRMIAKSVSCSLSVDALPNFHQSW